PQSEPPGGYRHTRAAKDQQSGPVVTRPAGRPGLHLASMTGKLRARMEHPIMHAAPKAVMPIRLDLAYGINRVGGMFHGRKRPGPVACGSASRHAWLAVT